MTFELSSPFVVVRCHVQLHVTLVLEPFVALGALERPICCVHNHVQFKLRLREEFFAAHTADQQTFSSVESDVVLEHTMVDKGLATNLATVISNSYIKHMKRRRQHNSKY